LELEEGLKQVLNSSQLIKKSSIMSISRDEKIRRFKREKELKGIIQELEKTLSFSQQSNSSTIYKEEMMNEEEEEEDHQERLERDWVLSLIQLHLQRALDNLDMIAAELPMVKMMKAKKEASTSTSTSTLNEQMDEASRLDVSLNQGFKKDGPLLSTEGKVSKFINNNNKMIYIYISIMYLD
jgi:immunoglobulin-binding protein 1